MEERRFDDLTKALARPVGRRPLLKGLIAAAVGTAVPLVRARPAAASGNTACDTWCDANFTGSAAGSCAAAAAMHKGPCYQCGPASPNHGQGQAVCNGKCTDITTIANCGGCGHTCPAPAHGTATCAGGQCGVHCNPGTCSIGGACYLAGAVNPANACQSCQPGQNTTDWITKTCTAGDQCHGVGQCDPATGLCSNPDLPDGTSCNDHNACTSGDACRAGVCTGTTVACAPINACYTAICDPAGGCQNTPKPAGTPCNADSNACTAGDACDGHGTCVPGQQLSCPPCQTCDQASGTCVADPAQAGHTCPGDGNQCFGAFACNTSGNCAGVHPVVCTAMDQCHVPGTCNPATGLCSNPNAADGTTCNDSNLCTQGDTCQAGVCTGGTPINCNDNNACTAETCDPAIGCMYTNVDCNDGIDCTIDTCDPVHGCVHTPDDSACSTNDPCQIPVCDPVKGCTTVPMDCDDGNPCTTDSCVGGQCVHHPNTALCNDGLKCTDDICTPAPGSPGGFECTHVANPANCGPLSVCQEALCGPGQDCLIVSHDDLCPPSDITCLAPVCTNTGCQSRDTCEPSNPDCNGCALCSCIAALNKCVPSCPT